MRARVLVVLLGASRGLLVPRRPSALRALSRRATATEPIAVEAAERSPVENAVRSLADVTLSLLAGNEDAAEELFADKDARRTAVRTVLDGFDGSKDGWLSRQEAEALFARLARQPYVWKLTCVDAFDATPSTVLPTQVHRHRARGGIPRAGDRTHPRPSRARGRRARHHQARRDETLPARR